jgi:5'-methylthioadenosine phosphorylase
MSYNAIAMVTDYDCWKDDTEAVDAQHVLKVISENVERVRALFVQAVKFIGQHDWEDVIKSNKVIFLIAIFLTAILQSWY